MTTYIHGLRPARTNGLALRPSRVTEAPERYTPKGRVERCQECGGLCDARYVRLGICRECELMEVKQ